jgi:DNA-binding XRE family transcriptional regulator
MKLTLKACRTNVKATAKEVAEYVGVTEDTIYNWESGKYLPKATSMQKLLMFFAEKGFAVSLNDINFLT